MFKKIIAATLLGCGLVLSATCTRAPSASVSPGAVLVVADIPDRQLTTVVGQYCVACHNDALVTGNLTLQQFDVARAADATETAERMIRKLRAGMMPPPGMPRPAGDTLVALVQALERNVDRVASRSRNPGSRPFQRINRSEYERLVQTLLGLEVNAEEWLPPDQISASFDNIA